LGNVAKESGRNANWGSCVKLLSKRARRGGNSSGGISLVGPGVGSDELERGPKWRKKNERQRS